MVEKLVKILLIEDNLAEARYFQLLIEAKSNNSTLVHVKRLGDALLKLGKGEITDTSCPFDVILLDLTLPDSEGLASLVPLIQLAPSLPIVVLTNHNDDELAIQAVRQGAQDYLVKRQVNGEILLQSLRYSIERKQALENLRLVNHNLEMCVEQRTSELVKVQQIHQSKSQFVSMLSHDTRNSLNRILLAASLLQNNEDKLPKDKKFSLFELIRSAVKNASQLLDKLSFIGQTDAGKIQYKFQQIDLEKFCFQLVDEIKLATDEQNINLIFTICGEFCKVALWDENLLRHILDNLLSNAIKYSPEGSNIHFNLINQESCVIFQIQDSGIGISEEDLPYIFESFRRAQNVGKISGTGLGLAIVKKCVEAYDGEISVSSQEGVGTTFCVTLPLIYG